MHARQVGGQQRARRLAVDGKVAPQLAQQVETGRDLSFRFPQAAQVGLLAFQLRRQRLPLLLASRMGLAGLL